MRKSNSKRTLFALVVGLALIVAPLTSCVPTSSQNEPAGPVGNAPGEIQRVTLEESKTAFDSGAAVFLDVRSASSYAAGHIPNALSIPLGEIESHIGELDPDQWIITYCT
jgi:3-mercaptopyruvate sulfurtransferase SseA